MTSAEKAQGIWDKFVGGQKGVPTMPMLLKDIAAGFDEETARWERLVREAADGLWTEGKACEDSDPRRARELKVIATNLHRLCQIAKGEEPLPAPGSRL